MLEPSTHDDLLHLLRTKKQSDSSSVGCVYLVGTGPGDPGLLTLRALQLMQSVDVVLYDRLVSPDILRLVHGGALMVYVGKERGFHTRSQEEIHELCGQFAGEGASVLRLKGGDPYVFGRGGEEMQYLQARGVRCVAVPGITAASGIAAELGIPLTHRGLAASVRFLTGHAREGGQEQLDEATLSACTDPHTTLVVYMGLSTLGQLAGQLLAQGLPPDTPAVAVERGTTPEQRLVFNTLQGLQQAVASAQLVSPTLIMVGAVVSLSPGWQLFTGTGQALQHPSLDWADCWGAVEGGYQPLPILDRLTAPQPVGTSGDLLGTGVC